MGLELFLLFGLGLWLGLGFRFGFAFGLLLLLLLVVVVVIEVFLNYFYPGLWFYLCCWGLGDGFTGRICYKVSYYWGNTKLTFVYAYNPIAKLSSPYTGNDGYGFFYSDLSGFVGGVIFVLLLLFVF